MLEISLFLLGYMVACLEFREVSAKGLQAVMIAAGLILLRIVAAAVLSPYAKRMLDQRPHLRLIPPYRWFRHHTDNHAVFNFKECEPCQLHTEIPESASL